MLDPFHSFCPCPFAAERVEAQTHRTLEQPLWVAPGNSSLHVTNGRYIQIKSKQGKHKPFCIDFILLILHFIKVDKKQ